MAKLKYSSAPTSLNGFPKAYVGYAVDQLVGAPRYKPEGQTSTFFVIVMSQKDIRRALFFFKRHTSMSLGVE
jgi:hypothetical protein